ncbi:MAG TPA: hypothetical protein VFU31_03980 [Candidatus Binatia bacterium]|nr:hypothetical protein [Candidatus Binatia bacterium]
MRHFTFAATALFLALSVEPFRCGIPTTFAQKSPPGVMITQGKTEQGFSYISGGVSSNEREVIESLAKAYNVRLSFAEKRGPYLSDVRLVIEGSKAAQIVAITTPGPLFYIQLPPGNYSVKATFNGQTKEIKRLEVPKDRIIQRTLVWDLIEMLD